MGRSDLSGASDAACTERLSRALDRGMFFIAHQVRLPELFFTDRPLYADDHCFHELGEVSTTFDETTDLVGRSFAEFVEEVERASRLGWQVFDRTDVPHFQSVSS
jgi:hypothetical protein